MHLAIEIGGTKLQLAVQQMLAFAKLAFDAGKRVWAVADGAYAKRPFLKPLRAAGVVVVSRLRKDAALFNLPVPPKQRGRGRPRKYGTKRMHLARRAIGSAPGVMLNSVRPQPISSRRISGSEAISPHTDTGMPSRTPPRRTWRSMRSTAGCSGS